MSDYRIIEGDCTASLATLPEQSVQTCVTSPPYWGLRDYGADGQLGLEPTPEEYVANMVAVFREVKRVLRDDGTLWLNLGDSYVSTSGVLEPRMNVGNLREGRGSPRQGVKPSGDMKPKDLVGIPWMVAFALRADGWYLRSDIIWAKPNPMPESVTDRPTKAHEYPFLLTKSLRYFYDADAIAENSAKPEGEPERIGQIKTAVLGHTSPAGTLGAAFAREGRRNKRSVWTVTTQPFPGAHFATFPPKLIEPCILAGSRPVAAMVEPGVLLAGDPTKSTVLDPFAGAGTTGVVALRHNRDFIGCELNPEYAQMARDRIYDDAPLLNAEAA